MAVTLGTSCTDANQQVFVRFIKSLVNILVYTVRKIQFIMTALRPLTVDSEEENG